MGKDNDLAPVYLLGILSGVIFLLVIYGLTSLGDTQDTINTKVFGSELCKAQGLSYDHREFFNVQSEFSTQPTEIPKIFCKNISAIIDGVVVKTK